MCERFQTMRSRARLTAVKKTAFTLTKQMIDDEKFYREKGRLGGQKIAERKRTDDGQTESDTVLKSVIETVVASELLNSLLGGQGENTEAEKA